MARNRFLSSTARAGAGLAAAALALCLAGAARADGLAFDGDLPAAPHLLLDLTPAQRQAVAQAARRGDAWPEVTLTGAQRRALKKAFGVEPRWVFAVGREALAGECTCGTFNLGVLAGEKLAVLQRGLGDHLGKRDVAAMERLLVDRALAARGVTPAVLQDDWTRAEPAPEPLQALAARLPAATADGSVRLPKGWKAQRLRVAGVPRIDGADRKDPAPALHALAAIAGQPSAASVLRWPELGARREAGASVLWLVPGLMTFELGPPQRAWFLLEYQGGRLVAAVAASGGNLAGATYGWEGQGGEGAGGTEGVGAGAR